MDFKKVVDTSFNVKIYFTKIFPKFGKFIFNMARKFADI